MGILPEPLDKFNQDWMQLVAPEDYTNPKPKEKYDLVVIGAGTAGLVTAAAAAGLGADVALIERHRMGGDCLNVGCVPSKALIHGARQTHKKRKMGLIFDDKENFKKNNVQPERKNVQLSLIMIQ